MAKRISKRQFKSGLISIKPPSDHESRMLQAHSRANGRNSTAAKLAVAAGYKNFRAVNLRYGLLAKRIGAALGMKSANLGLLLEFNTPRTLTNAHWVLHMKAEFAEALVEAGWITKNA